jgi:hypothetical protein
MDVSIILLLHVTCVAQMTDMISFKNSKRSSVCLGLKVIKYSLIPYFELR